MKKPFAFLLLPLFALPGYAQNALTITPGTTLYIAPNNVLHIDGLSLTPSTAYMLSGTNFTKAGSVATTGLASSISRAYRFSTTTAPFTGAIRFTYQDAELGSQNEAGLLLRMHNGSSWITATGTVRNGVSNYTEGTTTGTGLQELTLSSSNVLPLRWKSVAAYRSRQGVVVEWTTFQESGVRHFAVERSSAAGDWQVTGDRIAARNTASPEPYRFSDTSAPSHQLFYRIRQTDQDGQQSYSSLVAVAASATNHLAFYPNPVATTFSLQAGSDAGVKAVQLYNASGMLLKTWPGWQHQYTLPSLAPGSYYVSVLTAGGTTQQFSFIK